jgi:hypothetical protein
VLRNSSSDDIFDELVLNLKSILFEVVSLNPAKHEKIKRDNNAEISVPWFVTLLVVVYKSELFGVRNVSAILVSMFMIIVSVSLDKVSSLGVESIPSLRRVVDDFSNV